MTGQLEVWFIDRTGWYSCEPARLVKSQISPLVPSPDRFIVDSKSRFYLTILPRVMDSCVNNLFFEVEIDLLTLQDKIKFVVDLAWNWTQSLCWRKPRCLPFLHLSDVLSYFNELQESKQDSIYDVTIAILPCMTRHFYHDRFDSISDLPIEKYFIKR